MVIVVVSACGNNEGSSKAKKGADNDISTYPDRPVEIVVPYAAGGSGDLQARFIADSLQKELGQTVNVVSKPGGAGAVGMNYLMSQNPDGYTIILTAVGPSTLTPNSNDVGYNTPEDFEMIAQISDAPYGFAVNKSSGFDSLDDVLEYAKIDTERATYGTTGAGLHQHVVTSDFINNLEGVNMAHVPFGGGAEAVSALLGSHTTASMNTISELLPHVESDAINIVAVTSDESLKELPDVPTFKELGYDLIGTGAWFGFMAPNDTPEEIITLLDESIKEALEEDQVIEHFDNAGLPISYLNSKDFLDKVETDNIENAKVIKEIK